MQTLIRINSLELNQREIKLARFDAYVSLNEDGKVKKVEIHKRDGDCFDPYIKKDIAKYILDNEEELHYHFPIYLTSKISSEILPKQILLVVIFHESEYDARNYDPDFWKPY